MMKKMTVYLYIATPRGYSLYLYTVAVPFHENGFRQKNDSISFGMRKNEGQNGTNILT